MNLSYIRATVETFVLALLGALAFQAMHLPLSWILGPIAALLIWRTAAKRSLYWPKSLRNAGLVLIGYMLGASFTADTLHEIRQHIPMMLLVNLLLLLFCLGLGWLISRGTGLSCSHTLIGTIPGGFSQMVTLAEELEEVDVTIVTFIQLVRLLSVLFLVPFLAVYGLSGPGSRSSAAGSGTDALLGPDGFTALQILAISAVIAAGTWLAVKIHVPTPYLLGPVLITAGWVLAGWPAPPLPDFATSLAQLFLGAHVGQLFNRNAYSRWGRLFLWTFLSAVALIAFSFLLALGLTQWYPVSLATAFLSTAPGGIAEMGITAALVGADISMVTGYQFFRVFFILIAVPPVVRWWFRRKRKQA